MLRLRFVEAAHDREMRGQGPSGLVMGGASRAKAKRVAHAKALIHLVPGTPPLRRREASFAVFWGPPATIVYLNR
jgi:hypothetical protein